MDDQKIASSTLPELIGDKSFLRPATADDVENTYHWYILSNPQKLSEEAWAFQTAKEASEQFKKQERATDREKFMIIDKKSGTQVGWIGYDNFNPHNRSARFELVVDPDEQRKGFGTQALGLLIEYIFNTRGFNKLYISVAGSNLEMIALLEKLKFSRDGALRRHYFIDGEFVDGALFSLLNHEALLE